MDEISKIFLIVKSSGLYHKPYWCILRSLITNLAERFSLAMGHIETFRRIRMIKRLSNSCTVLLAGIVFVFSMTAASAAEYVIDGKTGGMHASIHFKASHIGISSIWGRFNNIEGTFTYDKDNISASKIEITIDPASVDTNHAARDDHLRTSDYIDVQAFPEIKFVSTSFEEIGEGMATVTGTFTLHGVSKEISFDIHRTGEGDTYLGDYRVGFEGTLVLALEDYDISLAPAPSQLELVVAIEGVRQ